jgi:hypothetical protein
MEANVRFSALAAAAGKLAFSSSITAGRTLMEATRLQRTSNFDVGRTTPTKPNWTLGQEGAAHAADD